MLALYKRTSLFVRNILSGEKVCCALTPGLWLKWKEIFLNRSACFKNVNNCNLNTNISSYLETSAGQSYNIYFNCVHFFNTSANWTSVAGV
jgi:hypothetical protein